MCLSTVGDRIAQERRLKSARECVDIDQKTVAEALGVSGPTISRWESGTAFPRDDALIQLAQYFGVNPAWLRYGTGPRRAEEEIPTVPGGLRPLRASGEMESVESEQATDPPHPKDETKSA